MHSSRTPLRLILWSPFWTAVTVFGMLLALSRAEAATINAASTALSDVVSAINSASDGDTVIVPAGTASWTSVITITKGITLQGATTVTNTGKQNAIATDLTVIEDDSPLNTNNSGLINATLTPIQNFHLTGFTFTSGSRTSTNDIGAVHLISTGNSPHFNMRVDHCHFDHIYGRNIQTDGWVYGVADHNYIEAQGNGQSVYINCANYGGYTQGHGAWADYPWFGTNKFFFIEDNTIVGNGIVPTSGAIDAEYGGRFVVRHNYFQNARPGWHGTEGGNRGCRAVEIYDNAYDWTLMFSALMRSGTALVHDNNWISAPQSAFNHNNMVIFRANSGVPANTPYGPADGTDPWDVNDTEGNGTNVDGYSPYLFTSGTASSSAGPSGTQATMTDTSKNWTPNQLAGCSIKQTNPSAASYGKASYIISNTANTITFYCYVSGDRGPTLLFAPRDAYEIHRVLICLDQPGRGKGDLLTGATTPLNTVTGTRQWPHQALEPAMSWNNIYTPTNIAVGYDSGGTPTEVEGRDYFNLGKGFSADSTPSQVASVYVAALNGVNYLGPFVYPHPLVSGTPTAPSNLRVTN